MKPRSMSVVLGGLRYSTEGAVLLASDAPLFERSRFLYRTAKGRYFLVTQDQEMDASDSLKPLSPNEAVNVFEGMAATGSNVASWEEAFPDRPVEDA